METKAEYKIKGLKMADLSDYILICKGCGKGLGRVRDNKLIIGFITAYERADVVCPDCGACVKWQKDCDIIPSNPN